MKGRFSTMEEWTLALRGEDAPVIVEGPKDRKALEGVGVQNVCTLSRTPLYRVVEDIASVSKRVIILTDLDGEGKILYGKLKKGFDRVGVIVDDSYRAFLFKETALSHIEGLPAYLEHQEQREEIRKMRTMRERVEP